MVVDEDSVECMGLLICDICRARLEAIEPANFVHLAADGTVYSRTTRLTTGKMMARYWSEDLGGGKVIGSVSAARKYPAESFSRDLP